jgi:hypothetical protein
MANDFNEIGRQVAEKLKKGSKDFFPITVKTDAFEMSELFSSEIPVEARQHFEDAEEIENTRQKFGYAKDDFEALHNLMEEQFENKKVAFYSQGEKLFETRLEVLDRASSGARSNSLNTYLNIPDFSHNNEDAERFSQVTGLPVPDQIGKSGLPALRRRFEDGERLNADLDDVQTLSDIFRAYGITELTIREPKKNNSDKKEKVKKTVKKTSETLEKGQKYFIAGSFGLTVLGIGYAIIKGEY